MYMYEMHLLCEVWDQSPPQPSPPWRTKEQCLTSGPALFWLPTAEAESPTCLYFFGLQCPFDFITCVPRRRTSIWPTYCRCNLRSSLCVTQVQRRLGSGIFKWRGATVHCAPPWMRPFLLSLCVLPPIFPSGFKTNTPASRFVKGTWP